MPLQDQSSSDLLRRLERRLERERQARLAAEAIAEKGIRDLYEEQRRLQLVESIAGAANLSDRPEAAFMAALEQICDFTDWPIGHVYMFPDGVPEGELVSAGLWRDGGDQRFGVFRKASEAGRYASGLGLPGRVLATGKPVLIEDVTQDDNFPRAAAAVATGLKGAFAFPAMIGSKVGAVLEFFTDRPAVPDAPFLAMLERVGVHLGRAVERHRTDFQKRAHADALAALYAEANIQRERAEQASQAKSSFLAVTSHEVRTPLNAVLGLAEALRREPLTPAQHELNDGVLASGATLLRLLNAVLDLSKIEADRAEAVITTFNLREMVRSVASIWSSHAAEQGVAVTVDDDALTASRIRSDHGRLEQTLINLVSNAVKFSPDGGRVHVRVTSRRGRLRMEVIDDGPGVADDERERIFQPYEQTVIGREAGGAGLGLAICSGNVRLLGGKIGTDRTDDGRNRFWFETPFKAAIGPPPRAAAARPTLTAMGTGPLRVLAAEDNERNRQVLKVLLEPAGVELTFAENGVQAVASARAALFDLVLMDANMPEMDGVTALAVIRALPSGRQLPIYMLTANAFDEDVARYLAAGADGVLTKPIEVPKLFALLNTVQRGETARVAAA